MYNLRSILAISTIAVLVTSCSPKVPFTQEIREQYKLTPEEMKHIQFYISDPVYLRRGSIAQDQKTMDQGKLVVKSGNSVEQVVIKAKTPGAIEQVVDSEKVTVAFEDGADKYLVFGSTGDQYGYYHLLALSWDKSRGKINYGGQTYYSNVGSDQAILMFRMKSLREFIINNQVAKGKVIK